MSLDLKPGDEVWVKAIVEDPAFGDDVAVSIRTQGKSALLNLAPSIVSKSPAYRREWLTDGSETAELEHKVVHMALRWRHNVSAVASLREAVDAFEKALAPSSLEDEIASLIREHSTLGPEAMAELILAIVEKHRQ